MVRVHDISLPLAGYRHFTPAGVPDVQLTLDRLHDHSEGTGQLIHAVRMRLHHGTHVDAPLHYAMSGAAIDEVPLDTFVGSVTILPLASAGPRIESSDLEAAAEVTSLHGGRVLLATGWNGSRREGAAPYLSVDAVEWVCQQRPALVGFDFPHFTDAPEAPTTYYAARRLLQAGICILAMITGLERINRRNEPVLVAVPLALGQVEASPVRAIVLETRSAPPHASPDSAPSPTSNRSIRPPDVEERQHP